MIPNDEGLMRFPRLAERNIRFTGGQPTLPVKDREFTIAIDHSSSGEGLCHLVTVFAGLPPPLDVVGLLCTLRRAGDDSLVQRERTNRRGQVRLAGLEPVEYRLRVEPRPMLAIPPEFRDRVRDGLAGATTDTGWVLRLPTADDNYQAALCGSTGETNRLVLLLDVDAGVIEGDLILAEITDQAGHALVRGYVGLGIIDEGRRSGELVLDFLPKADAIASTGPSPLYLRLEAVPARELEEEDRDLLTASLQATNASESRGSIERGLKVLRLDS